MNFNYSYRAFLITCLLFGILILTLWSIKISSEIAPETKTPAIQYEEVKIKEPKEDLAKAVQERVEIKTNKAYNEAENFINKLENERLKNDLTAETSPNTANGAPTESAATKKALAEAKKRIEKQKQKIVAATENKPVTTGKKGAIRKTTLSYSLKNRTSLRLPNPVFTCEGGGKVVISIRVNQLGKVTKTTYNKNASTTFNGCLIDSALIYAQRARFNTKAGADEQKGTITYNFPGQY